MRRFIILLLLAILAYFFYHYFFPQAEPERRIREVVSEKPVPGGVWQQFYDPEGKFVVDFPSTPQHASDVVNDPLTRKRLAFETYISPGVNQNYFILTVVDYPSDRKMDSPANIFENRLKDMLSSNPRNQLDSQKPTRFLNREALDVEISNENSLFLNKLVVDGNTLFVLTMLQKGKERHDELFQRFVDSFHLTSDAEVEKQDAKVEKKGS